MDDSAAAIIIGYSLGIGRCGADGYFGTTTLEEVNTNNGLCYENRFKVYFNCQL